MVSTIILFFVLAFLLGIAVGYILAFLAEEELEEGKKYFTIARNIILALFIASMTLSILSEKSQEYLYLSGSLFFFLSTLQTTLFIIDQKKEKQKREKKRKEKTLD